MKIKRKQSQPSSDGWHSAVCADAVDLGIQNTAYGPKPKLDIVHLVDERDATGQLIQVHDRYTASVHPSSKFYKPAMTITGGELKFDANGEFDTDCLLGRTYQIHTARRVTSKGVFANVDDLRPLPAGAPRVAIPLNFVRAEDRPRHQSTTKPNGGMPPLGTDQAVEFPSS
jgi:hypothetical protein